MKKRDFLNHASTTADHIGGESYSDSVCIAIMRPSSFNNFKVRMAFEEYAFEEYARVRYCRVDEAYWLSCPDTIWGDFYKFENYGYRLLVWGDFVDYCLKTKLYRKF